MKNKKLIKCLFLIVILSVLIVGCNNTDKIKEEQTANKEQSIIEEDEDSLTSKVIDLSDKSVDKTLALDNYALKDVEDNFEKINITLPNNLDPNDLDYVDYDLENKTIFFLKATKDNPWGTVVVFNYGSNDYKEVELLGKKYSYLDSSRTHNGVCDMVMSSTGETADLVKVTDQGDVTIEEIDTFDRIASTVWEGGTVVAIEKEEKVDEQVVLNSSITLIDDDSKKETVVEKQALLGEKNGERNIVDGGTITVPNVFSNGLGYQVGSDIGYSLDRYKVDSYWMDIDKKEIHGVKGLNDLCTYFAGNDNCFITLISSDKANDTGDASDLQNGFIYFKENDGYKRYLLPGYAPVYTIKKARPLDENYILILADGFVDILNTNEKLISRLNLQEIYNAERELEKYYLGVTVSGNKISFLEFDKKNNMITLYVGELKDIMKNASRL